jgi:hypothetical protein
MNSIGRNETVNKNSPLMIYEPFNILVFLSVYSPIIISIGMLALSFAYQNVKGFVFFGYLVGMCIIRNFVYSTNGAESTQNDGTICTSVQYSKYGNSSFSAFVFAFTISYLAIPMFTNSNVNYWVFMGLIIYFLVDIFLRLYKKCIIKITDVILNILCGIVSAAAIVSAMYSGGSSGYLFYNSTVSDAAQCSMPNKQTFKCAVYKNGELVAGTTTT